MKPINNEKGAVLIVALIIMGVLMVIGTVITMTASTELKIARNEKIAKTVFYRAENGRVIAAMAAETAAWGGTVFSDGDTFEDNDIIIRDGDFIMEDIEDADTASGSPDVEMTGSLSANVDVDKLYVEPLPGSSAEFASGYEGAGKMGAVQVVCLIDSIGSFGRATSRVQVKFRLVPQ